MYARSGCKKVSHLRRVFRNSPEWANNEAAIEPFRDQLRKLFNAKGDFPSRFVNPRWTSR